MAGTISSHSAVEKSYYEPLFIERASQSADYFTGLLQIDRMIEETQAISSFKDRDELARSAPLKMPDQTYFEQSARQVDLTLYKMNGVVSKINDRSTALKELPEQIKINVEAIHRRRFLDVILAAKGAVGHRIKRDTFDVDPNNTYNVKVKSAAEDGVKYALVPVAGELGITSKRLFENLGRHRTLTAGTDVTMGGGISSPSNTPLWLTGFEEFVSIASDTSGGTASAGVLDWKTYGGWDSITRGVTPFIQSLPKVMGYAGMQLGSWAKDGSIFTALDSDSVIEEVAEDEYELIRNTFLMTTDAVQRYARMDMPIQVREEPKDPTILYCTTAIHSAAMRVEGSRIRVIPVRHSIAPEDVAYFKIRGRPIYPFNKALGKADRKKKILVSRRDYIEPFTSSGTDMAKASPKEVKEFLKSEDK